MQLAIPVLGMAKDDSHRTRALVNGRGEEYILRGDPLLFQFCGAIQEEVHRFAIDYHRKLHNKNSIGSVLDHIDGIGPVKRNALFEQLRERGGNQKSGARGVDACTGHHRKKRAGNSRIFWLIAAVFCGKMVRN